MSEEKPKENGTDEEEVDNWDKWRRAGVVAKEALALARPMIEPGTKVLDIINTVEDIIGYTWADIMDVLIREGRWNEKHFYYCSVYSCCIYLWLLR